MAQGRSTQIISMIQWIRTSRLSIKNCLSLCADQGIVHCRQLFLLESPPSPEFVNSRMQRNHWSLFHILKWTVSLGIDFGKKQMAGSAVAGALKKPVFEGLSSARESLVHFRAKNEQLKKFQGLLPQRQGQNPAFTVIDVSYLDQVI